MIQRSTDPLTALTERSSQLFLLLEMLTCPSAIQHTEHDCPAPLTGPSAKGHRVPPGRDRSQFHSEDAELERLRLMGEEDFKAR